MRTFKELVLAVQQGKHFDVVFKAKVEDLEAYPEGGMRATIVGAGSSKHDDVVWLQVDYTRYEEHNIPLAEHNYYDKNGVPCLTAHESGFYERVEKIYFMETDIVDEYMTIGGNDLYEQYEVARKMGLTVEGNTYVQWLEDQVRNMSTGIYELTINN